MGLFADIWNYMKGLVQDLIDAALETFKYWVNEAIQAAINAVDWVVTNVYNFIDNSVHYIDESIHYWGDQITQNVTNVVGASIEWVTEGLAKNREWTINFLKLSDPFGFLKDPMGYINAAFNVFINPWGHGIVKSFWEGFEEGLEE